MADDVLVSNTPTSSNTDIPVRTTETAGGKQIQHMRLDLGVGSAESVVSGTVPVSGTVTAGVATSATATLTNVASSVVSQQLIASNTSRRGLTIYNDSTQSLYVKFGTTASSSSFTVILLTQAYYELPQPVFTGRIDGVWNLANGSARLTELT